MKIDTILNRKGHEVVTVKPSATVRELAQVLGEHRIGAVVVSETGKTVDGIVSERDIVRRLTDFGPGFLKVAVSEIMTRKVVTCTPDSTVEELMDLMTTSRVRHLPVVENGVLTGVVSIGDIVKAHMDSIKLEADALKSYIATG